MIKNRHVIISTERALKKEQDQLNHLAVTNPLKIRFQNLKDSHTFYQDYQPIQRLVNNGQYKKAADHFNQRPNKRNDMTVLYKNNQYGNRFCAKPYPMLQLILEALHKDPTINAQRLQLFKAQLNTDPLNRKHISNADRATQHDNAHFKP